MANKSVGSWLASCSVSGRSVGADDAAAGAETYANALRVRPMGVPPLAVAL